MNNRKYHLEMMLNELRIMRFPNKGDTRNYLSIDELEWNMLKILFQSELDKELK